MGKDAGGVWGPFQYKQVMKGSKGVDVFDRTSLSHTYTLQMKAICKISLFETQINSLFLGVFFFPSASNISFWASSSKLWAQFLIHTLSLSKKHPAKLYLTVQTMTPGVLSNLEPLQSS